MGGVLDCVTEWIGAEIKSWPLSPPHMVCGSGESMCVLICQVSMWSSFPSSHILKQNKGNTQNCPGRRVLWDAERQLFALVLHRALKTVWFEF